MKNFLVIKKNENQIQQYGFRIQAATTTVNKFKEIFCEKTGINTQFLNWIFMDKLGIIDVCFWQLIN